MSVNDMLDNAAGKAHKNYGESLRTFLASLTTSGAIFGFGITAYLLLRVKFPDYYYERAHRVFNSKWKPRPMSLQMLLSPVPDPHLKHASGFENYLFDRYLHTITRIFITLGLIIMPILVPLNVAHGKNASGGVKGLDLLSISNIGLSHTDKYWAHLLLAILVVVSVCYTLQQELRDYSRIRSIFQASKNIEESSLLIVSRSKGQQLSVDEIQRHFHSISGGINSILINRDYSSLHCKLLRRDAFIRNLEVAETRLIQKANCPKNHRKPYGKDESYPHPSPLWMKYLCQKDRPSTRLPAFSWLPSLPFIGAKVDAIYHFRTEVARYNIEIQRSQQHSDEFPEMNSAFVRFNKDLSTPSIALAIKAQAPPSWTLKQGTTAADIIWSNVSISWWQQIIQTAFVYSLAAALTLGFALPVAITGSLSQIGYLTYVVPWLRQLESLPSWALATIQGDLPLAILSLITAMVPSVLRLLANMQGLHSRQGVENYVQIYYFSFLFVQVFLTVSLSAGITTIIGQLPDTVEALPTLLAQNLPKASNYFFSYIMVHAFTTFAFTLMQITGLISMFALSPLFDKSPRQKWMRRQSLGLQKWGTFVPVFTNMACIGLIYSVIAPLILVFSMIYFGALWVLYRFYPPKLSDLDLGATGLFYPTAIRQLMTGIYFMELCLAGLFFLVRDADGNATCTAQAIIMIVTMAFTALFHFSLDHRSGFHWLSSRPIFKQLMAQTESKGKDMRVSTKIFQSPCQDETLTSDPPVLWIPRDELGVAEDEIVHTGETYNSIRISCDGVSLSAQGNLILRGQPPDWRLKSDDRSSV